MTDDKLLLGLEPSIELTDDARVEWLEARSKIVSGGADDREVTRLKLLRRAYVDEQRSSEKRTDSLSVRLQKLWSERGDFSRFRASELTAGEEKKSERKGDADPNDLGINLQGLIDEGNGAEAGDTKVDVDDDTEKEEERSGDVMTIEQMRQLRGDMLQRLGIAHNSVYFSHALVSLLINSTKAGGADGSGDGRAGSAGSVSAVAPAAARLGGMAAAASASGLQRSMAGVAPSVGSTSTLEAELGVEPHVFGASKIEAQRRAFEARINEDLEYDTKLATGDEDEDIDEEDAAKEASARARYDAQLLDHEISDHARKLVDCFEGKVQGLRSAVDILRKGASMLQPDDEASKHEKSRWQTLVKARQAGWGITPGKPARGTAAGKRELLPDLSGRRKDEPARDAWIGYGVPESHPSYRRRALAYVSHTAPSNDESLTGLLFTARPSKRVRVEIVIGTEVWSSQNESKDDGKSINGVLRTAQSQMFDTELFDTLVAESRALLASGLVPVTMEHEDAISFQLNTKVRLRVSRSENLAGEEKETQIRHTSALVNSMLAYLRLGLVSRFRERAGLGKRAATKAAGQDTSSDAVIAPLMQPMLGILHYASFVAHLNGVLSIITRPRRHLDVLYELNAFQDGGTGASTWLSSFLQGKGSDAAMRAVEGMDGNAIVSIAGEPVARLTLAYPSKLSLSLKGAKPAPVTLTSLRSLLEKELDSRGS